MDRRSLLVGLAAASVGLAGCLEGGGGTAGGENSGGDGDSEPSIEASGIETTGSDCASGDADEAELVSGAAVTVRGTIRAGNPCHDAVLTDVALESGTLTLTIGVESLDQICMQCVGAIDYEATVEVDDVDALADVVVEHEGGDSHAFTWDAAAERDDGTV